MRTLQMYFGNEEFLVQKLLDVVESDVTRLHEGGKFATGLVAKGGQWTPTSSARLAEESCCEHMIGSGCHVHVIVAFKGDISLHVCVPFPSNRSAVLICKRMHIKDV